MSRRPTISLPKLAPSRSPSGRRLLCAVLLAGPALAVQVGEDAPDFIVQDINGDSSIILSDHRGSGGGAQRSSGPA